VISSIQADSGDEAFTAYTMTVELEGVPPRQLSRRFRDFRFLNERLLTEFAFTPLPAFPYNSVAELFIGSNYLVASRVTELDKWMNAILAIPKVSRCHHLMLFLNLYDLSKKVAIVTGSNTGLGKQTAQILADNRCQLVLACRSMEKGEEAAREIRKKSGNESIIVMCLDLSSFESIKKFVQRFTSEFKTVDLLINNAGFAHSSEQKVTEEGFNPLVGVNYIGTVLLTCLLLNNVAKDGRIVNVSSKLAFQGINESMRWGDQIKTVDDGEVAQLRSYGFSKLLLSIWTQILAEKLKKTEICTFSLHPGVVATDIWRDLPEFLQWGVQKFLTRTDEGVAPILYCALDPTIKNSSGHFFECDCTDVNTKLTDYLATAPNKEDLVTLTWSETKKWIGGHFDFESCAMLQ